MSNVGLKNSSGGRINSFGAVRDFPATDINLLLLLTTTGSIRYLLSPNKVLLKLRSQEALSNGMKSNLSPAPSDRSDQR
jgi:hypothetical protein